MPALQFDRIALSLSGGGFRAAAYGLGTLKTLHLLGLLDRVHLLSTASGGTLVGLYYAQRRKASPALPFATIYQDFYDWLAQDSLLPHALAQWEQRLATPRPKLSKAFADVYDQELYAGGTFGSFWPAGEPDAPFHLQSVIFSATELYSGLTFRFQHSAFLTTRQRAGYVVGNGNVRLAESAARQLRLGDIAAASTCFPGGFEPLVLPDDFLPPAAAVGPAPVLQAGRTGQPLPVARVALLDGGIYDNQGIESLLLANERNRRHRQNPALSAAQAALLAPSTLYLIADVSGPAKGIYHAPGPAAPGASPTLPRLGAYAAGSAGLLLGLAGVLYQQGYHFWSGGLAGATLTLVGLAGGLLLSGWRRLAATLRAVGPEVPGWVLPRLGRVSWRQWKYLVGLRLKSTYALLTTVFVRRIRSLNYEALYRRLDEDAPAYQVVASIIGLLATEYERRAARRPLRRPPPAPSVQDQLAAVYPLIQAAQAMPTTLWWQHHRAKLPALVASAELTLCYQLLRRFEQQPPAPGTGPAEVQRRAQLLWAAYQQGGPGLLVPATALPVLQQPLCTVAELLRAASPPPAAG